MKYNIEIPPIVKDRINGDPFIKEVLVSLKRACLPRIDYVIVKKDALISTSLRNAPYGIAYNYFAGRILIPRVLNCRNCSLIVDKRNKEVHSCKHFDGYIETSVHKEALEKQIQVDFDIQHQLSHIDTGLQAVDFFSWSVYRMKSMNDLKFFRIFRDLVCIKEEWYC